MFYVHGSYLVTSFNWGKENSNEIWKKNLKRMQ